MLGENLSYYKSKLKHAEKSGPQWVTIEEIHDFKDEKGKDIIHLAKTGIVIKYSNDNISHEELYWIVGEGFKELKNLLKMFDGRPLLNLKGKQLWIVIRHNITMNGDTEVKRESEIVHYSADEKAPNYPQIFEEYDIVAI